MGVDTLAQTAGVIANGAQNAGQLEQQRQEAAAAGQAPPASPFDVLSHTGTGLASKDLGDHFMDRTPAGALVGLFHTATQPCHSSELSAIPDAMSQGWDAVKASAAKVGTAEGGLATFGAVMGTLQSLEQMLSMAVSAIPFPAFPAIRILDMDVGLPHAHAHPPNLIPPAPPVPLPSTGPIIPIPFVSGANKTLLNMMPAARCGDMGLGIWCGGYFPMYEVFLGSSSVWIEGNRAARLAVDITKHCIFSSPKPSDPPMGPMIGFTVTSSANVLIGGVPMPSLLNLAMGAALKGLFKGLGKVASAIRKRFAKARPPASAAANSASHPINVVTGANYDCFDDFFLDATLPIHWRRYYSTARANQTGPMGFGFRHEFQRTLACMEIGFEYTDQDGNVVGFGPLDPQSRCVANDGLLLMQFIDGTFEIHETGQPVMQFVFAMRVKQAPLSRLVRGDRSLEFVYDHRQYLSEIRQQGSVALELTHDDQGRITQVSRPNVDVAATVLASYSYDQLGDLRSVIDACGGRKSYEYDADHRLTRSQTALGYGFNFAYDSVGRCVRAFGDDGLYDTSMAYFPVERRSMATYADGAAIEYHYSTAGSLTYVSSSGGVARTYVTDEAGRVLEELDAAGNKWEWLYDTWGGNIGRRDPLGHVLKRLDLDPTPADPNQLVLPTTPLEWELGRTFSVTQAQSVLQVNDPLFVDTPAAVYNHFLNRHQKLARTEPTKVLDELGRVVREVDLDDSACEYVHDVAGNVVQSKDRDGEVTRFKFGSWNKLLEKTSPTGLTTRFEYTIREYLTKITDPGGTLSHYVYNHRDQIAEVRRHGRTRETYEYDASGNLVAKLAADGRPLVRWKSGIGKVDVERQSAEGDVHQFKHDERGRIVGAAWDEGRHQLECAYDFEGHLLLDKRDGLGVCHEPSVSGGLTTTYFDKFIFRSEYDTNGNLNISDPMGRTHRFHFAQSGFVRKWLGNGSCEIARFDWRSRCVDKVTWSETTSADRPWARSYNYTAEDELREAKDSQAGTTRFEYDADHRLAGVIEPSGQSYEILRDPAGNIVSMAGLQDVGLESGNRISHIGGHPVRYNERDHIEFREGSSGSTAYSYNSLDQLVAVDTPNGKWQAGYDPLYRRTDRRFQGKHTAFYWDGHRLAAEIHDAARLRIYVYPDRHALVPFMFVEYENLDAEPDQGTAYYIFSNQIGAPIQVQDQSGNEVWKARYEPYGRVRLSSANRVRLDLRFPGHFHDEEIDLHFNRYRYYDPGLGRYLASDPIGIAGGLNLYAYAPNPLVHVDLVGLAHGPQSGVGGNGVKAEAAVESAAAQIGHATPWAQMTAAQRKAFQHSYSRHAAELGLPPWSQKNAEALRSQFNNVAGHIRSNGTKIPNPPKKPFNGQSVDVNFYEGTFNGTKYYYYETLDGKFISAGKAR